MSNACEWSSSNLGILSVNTKDWKSSPQARGLTQSVKIWSERRDCALGLGNPDLP